MVDFHPYPAAMPQEFDPYSNPEQQYEFVPASHPFVPSSYAIDPTFSAPYEFVGMTSMAEAPRPEELQYHYDGIAQGVKYSPHGSPQSMSHLFEHPPILSASSESGASVTSSTTPSPHLGPQYSETWNPMTNTIGLPILQSSPNFEFEGLSAEKVPGCVGESTTIPTSACPSPSASLLKSVSSSHARSEPAHVFKSPSAPASATLPGHRAAIRSGRRNSILSREVLPGDIPDMPSYDSSFFASVNSSPKSSSASPSSCWFPLPPFSSQCNCIETFTDKPYLSDPSLVQPYMQFPQSPYPAEIRPSPSPYFPIIEQPPSPALSVISSRSQRPGSNQFKRASQSPYPQPHQFHPYSRQRRRSDVSLHSQHSGASPKSINSFELDDATREKGLCPLPECGRVFKDLKAHMLTHQNERPEKCPIATCEYHLKGFARKYDKNRHTLTHYKGTMVCGFCPGSGSAAEKSFNRADVFKRHLTSVHGVEQNPPNSRKKSPGGRKNFSGPQNLTGTCSTCSVTFGSAQEFYEHLDDCVLRVVQQADPAEAINQRLLTSVAEDRDVTETLDRNGLSNSIEYTVPVYDEDVEEEEEEVDIDDANDDTYGVRRSRSGKGALKSTKPH